MGYFQVSAIMCSRAITGLRAMSWGVPMDPGDPHGPRSPQNAISLISNSCTYKTCTECLAILGRDMAMP